jgi:general secretion pathway protein G
VRSKESMLKNQLYALRFTIDEYTFDKKHPPQSLGDLVQAGYLREIPIDPMTASDLTWLTSGQSNVPGIVDVQSGSKAASLDGSPYSEW